MSSAAAWAAAASRSGRIRATAIALLAVLAAAIWIEPSITRTLQWAWFDACQAAWPRPIASMPATIVAIDQRSLASLGQWPWPRSVLAQLIDSIERNNPAAIGVDILMPEADGASPERMATRVARVDPALAAELARLPTNDALLSRALEAAPTVLAVAGSAEATGSLLRAPPVAVAASDAAAVAMPAGSLPVPQYAGAIGSVEALDRAARARGLISVEPAGGVIRRIPLVASIGGTLLPAFAIEMIRVAIGAPSVRLLVSDRAIRAIAVGDFMSPTEADGAARLHYSPHNSDRYVSAVDVLDGRVDPAQLERKLVLVGVTGVGMTEDKTTPLGMPMPGVEIHAQLLESLFDGTLLQRPAWAPAVEAVVFLVLGALLIHATPRSKPFLSAALAAGSIAMLFALAYGAFRTQRQVFDAATPALALVLLYLTLLTLTLAEAMRQRRQLEQAIGQQREANARMLGELEAARRIQTASLPRPDFLRGDSRIDLDASMIPARQVGGDLYDFFRLDDHRLFLLVGDVAGKGLSASIFMAVSKALYKSTMLRAPADDIGALMSAANAEVSRDNPEMLFVTAFAAVLDLDLGELSYCNAGHENPYVTNDGREGVRRIVDGDGPPLCTVDDFRYRGGRCLLRSGDQLCIVTDGVTEAQNGKGELYGSARVERVLLGTRQRGVAAAAVVASLRADVEAFAGGAERADDMTVLVLRWNAPPGAGAAPG